MNKTARKLEPCSECDDPAGATKAGKRRPFRDRCGRCHTCYQRFRRAIRGGMCGQAPPCILCLTTGGPIEPLTGTHGRVDGRCYRCLREEVAHDLMTTDGERAYIPTESEIEAEAEKIRETWGQHRFCHESRRSLREPKIYCVVMSREDQCA